MISILLAGCKKHQAEYNIYYLNKNKTEIVMEEYKPVATDTDSMVVEFLAKTSQNTTNVNLQKPFPDSVYIKRYKLENRLLSLYFNAAYNDMPTYEEVMCRGAIVEELMQIDGVDGVIFYVEEHQLKDAKGMTIGMMNNDSFVGNPGVEQDEDVAQNDNIEVIN